MFKAQTLLILTILIASQASLLWADSTTNSQSFKLSVTIPVIVGVNDAATQAAAIYSQPQAKTTQPVQEQIAVRGDTEVVLRSVVAL